MFSNITSKIFQIAYHYIPDGHNWAHQGMYTWMRLSIVVAVFAVSLFLSVFGSTRELLLLLVAMFGFAGLIILLRWPAIGILMLLPLSINIPLSGPGGINAAIIGVAGLTGLWIINMVIRQNKFRLASSHMTLPVIALLVSSVISFLIGQIPWYPLIQQAPISAQVGGLLVFLLSGAVFLLIGNQIRDLRWLQALVWIFIFLGALYILGRLVPPIANYLRQFYQPGATTGSMFWIWLMVLPFSQAVINHKLPWPIRAALLAFFLATVYIAFFQSRDWKSGYIPPLAGIGAIIALKMKRRVFLLAPIAIIAVIYLGTEAIASDQYSYNTRLVAWEIVLQIAKVNPISGLGFANYYWYTPLFPILGYAINFNSHSQFVDIIAQTGLVGLSVYLWFFWSVGRLGLEILEKVPEGFAKAYVYGALGGAAGMLVASLFVDWVLPFVYNIGLNGFRASVLGWIFLGGLVSIKQIARDSAVSQS